MPDQSGRRGSFVERAALQKRRPSMLERAVDAIQSENSVNTELAVKLNFTYFWVVLGGVVALLFILPATSILFGLLPFGFLYVTFGFIRSWSPAWPFKTAFRQYIKIHIIRLVGMYNAWRYHRDSLNVRAVQEEVLMKFLTLYRHTAYSRDHNLVAVKDSEDFRRTQPLSKYEQYRPYVQREMNGEKDVLVTGKIMHFGRSSGTTGEPTIAPWTKQMDTDSMAAVSAFLYHARRHVDWEKYHNLRPVWKSVYLNPKITEMTPAGVPVGSISGKALWTKDQGEIYTAPYKAFEIADVNAAGYVQLQFALAYRELGAIEGAFASVVYLSFKKLEAEWQSLVENIRYGTIRQDLDTEDDIREALLEKLRPDPARADELEAEFETGFDNIVPRIWPELTIINCVTTGPFEIYAAHIREKYAKDILMCSASVVATEGFPACNFWIYRQPPNYTLIPRLHFYEFIPVDHSEEAQPETLLIDQIQAGQDYEIVLTSHTGFNRYRLGDVVRVVDFYNQVPLVEFQHRAGVLLSIKGEKVTDILVVQCLREAVQQMPEKVKEFVDYTTCENVMLDVVGFKTDKKGSYHVVFFEIIPQDSNTALRKTI